MRQWIVFNGKNEYYKSNVWILFSIPILFQFTCVILIWTGFNGQRIVNEGKEQEQLYNLFVSWWLLVVVVEIGVGVVFHNQQREK